MEDFKKLVAKMREAQKEYFRTREKTALKKSKELERQVDEELKRSYTADLFATMGYNIK